MIVSQSSLSPQLDGVVDMDSLEIVLFGKAIKVDEKELKEKMNGKLSKS